MTRCPNPSCALVFAVDPASLGKNLPCPGCGQLITATPIEALLALDEERRRREGWRPEARRPISGILDNIRSLWNVGAIFRTADAAGLDRLCLCGITGCPPRREITKTALGAEEAVPWQHFSTTAEAIASERERGRTIVAIEEDGAAGSLLEAAPAPPVALVLGNEVAGVGREALDNADLVLSIPMHGLKRSLNVAVAFGIAAYAVTGAE